MTQQVEATANIAGCFWSRSGYQIYIKTNIGPDDEHFNFQEFNYRYRRYHCISQKINAEEIK